MPQQELKIKIGADVAQGVNGIKQFSREVNTLPGTMGKVDAATKKTSQNFTNFSRVIQDLPFGIIGIQNNLTQLVPNIGALGLAVSAITAGFTFAQIGLSNWSSLFPSATDKIKDQIKAIKENREALENYVELLDDVTKARILGEQNAQKELVSLKTLYDATQNQNIAIGKRKQLVDELQEQYPKYFANIKDEVILAGGAQKAYEKLAAAILASSKARAGQDILVDLQKELLAVDQQYTQSLQKQSDAYQTLQAARKKFTDDLKRQGITPTPGAQPGGLQAKELYDVESDTNELFQKREGILKRIRTITGEITSIVQDSPDALLDPTGNLEKAKKKAELKARPFLLPVEPVMRDIPKINAKLSKDFKGNPAVLPVEPDLKIDAALLKVAGSTAAIRELGARFGTEMSNALGEAFRTKIRDAIASGMSTEQLEKFQEALRNTISIGIVLSDVLGNAFAAFGQALVQGQNALQAFFGSVKNALSQLIGQLLKTIATAAILSAITGGAAGGGMSFVGALKSLLSVKPFARGGLAFGPTLGLVGEGKNITRSNPEVISPLSDLKKFIGGQDKFPAYLPVHEISGDTLRLWYAKANKSGRMFQ